MTARDRFIGSWRLVAFTAKTEDGKTLNPLGERPGGLLSYTADGMMSVHLVAEPGVEPGMTMADYTGYYGPFSVSEKDATVTHHIENASEANMVGTDQLRGFRFEEDRLTLSADVAGMRMELVWRRGAAES